MTAQKYSIHNSKQSQIDKVPEARESLRKNLEKTPNRLETVRMLHGIEIICDSRCADLLSTRDTFKCINKPIVWLAAFARHDRDYSLIGKFVKMRVKAIVVYGGNGNDMERKLGGSIESFASAENLQDALNIAYKKASDGDALIFSPSCKIDDGYVNFADRGDAFKKMVAELK